MQVYSQEVNLDGTRTYPAKYSNDYEFKIKAPTKKEVSGFEIKNEVLNAAIKIAGAVGGFGRIKWKLKVRLDAKGVDLKNGKSVHVNLIDSNQVANPSTI